MLFLAGWGHWQEAAGLPVCGELKFFTAQCTMHQGIISSANYPSTPPKKRTKKRKESSNLKVYKNIKHEGTWVWAWCLSMRVNRGSLFHPGNDCVSPIRRWLNQTPRWLLLRGGKYVNHTLPLTQGNSLKLRMESGREENVSWCGWPGNQGPEKYERREGEKETERGKKTQDWILIKMLWGVHTRPWENINKVTQGGAFSPRNY